MANLRFFNKHNMVAFLKKPTESEGFTQAVDFLKGNALNYALTYNPTVYDSLVKQFWQTATVRTFANGTQQIEASIDNKPYNITKASVRSKLNWQMQQLSSYCIDLSVWFLQIVLEITPSNTGKYLPKILTKKIFANMRRGYEGDFVPLMPAMLAGAAQVQGKGLAVSAGSQSHLGPTPTFVADKATSTGVEVNAGGATTTTSGLDAGLESGFVTPSKTSGDDQVEDIIPTTLEAAKTLSKVASQQPKSVDKGKRYKRRKESKGKRVDTGLDFEDIGFDDISTGFSDGQDINTGIDEVNTGSLPVSTGSGPVSTDSTRVLIPSLDKGQREGKAPMIIEEAQAPKKTKEQILQEEASLAEAIRLDALDKEERAKQVHLDALLAQRIAEEYELTEQQKKRKAQVQFKAQHYTDEDWDVIRAKLEANEELSKSVLGSDLQEEDFAKKMVELVN
ncbi:hypothetical protein Tco_1287337 [Tanacetum coccineum]